MSGEGLARRSAPGRPAPRRAIQDPAPPARTPALV